MQHKKYTDLVTICGYIYIHRMFVEKIILLFISLFIFRNGFIRLMNGH